MIQNYDAAVRKLARTQKHLERREGDEMACSCGARWDVGEKHP